VTKKGLTNSLFYSKFRLLTKLIEGYFNQAFLVTFKKLKELQ